MNAIIVIKDLRPFCIFKEKELGLAKEGYFASTKYVNTFGDEFKTEVLGESFGWIDLNGMPWKDRKYKFRRPTEEEVMNYLHKDEYESLLDMAVRSGYVDLEADVDPGEICYE